MGIFIFFIFVLTKSFRTAIYVIILCISVIAIIFIIFVLIFVFIIFIFIILFIIFTKHQQLCTFAILLWVEPKLKSELWNARMELATELGSLQHGMAGNCFFNLFNLIFLLLTHGDNSYYLDDCNYFHHYCNSRRGWRSLLSICSSNNNNSNSRTNNYSRRNNHNNHNYNNYNNNNNNNNNDNNNNNYYYYNNYNYNNGRNHNDNICYRRWWYFRKWQCRITPTYQALSSSFKV